MLSNPPLGQVAASQQTAAIQAWVGPARRLGMRAKAGPALSRGRRGLRAQLGLLRAVGRRAQGEDQENALAEDFR